MEKVHIQVRNRLSLKADMEFAGVGESPEHGRKDAHLPRKLQKPLDLVRTHRERHPLLGFAQQYLPGIEAVILQGRLLQFDHAPVRVLRHLADRRGKPARTVVGNRVVEALIPRTRGSRSSALGDGIAYLHGARGRRLR